MELGGSKQNTIKQINRGMVLQMILLEMAVTRADISRRLGLTKTTLTNIVSELIESGVVIEADNGTAEPSGAGRKSIQLDVGAGAPLICGILLQRRCIVTAVSDLKGRIVAQENHDYHKELSHDTLKEIITAQFRSISSKVSNRIFAVGISSLGPIDVHRGLLLQPQRFYTEKSNFPLVDFVRELTQVPVFLCHDVSAAALAEKIFGSMRDESNFIYLMTIHGIGAGLFLDNKNFVGDTGQNGELGHTSIDYNGIECSCGRKGCVEQYANTQAILNANKAYADYFPNHTLWDRERNVGLFDVISLAEKRDPLAMILLNQYCRALARAVVTLTQTLGVKNVIITNLLEADNNVFELMLEKEINQLDNQEWNDRVMVRKSAFGTHGALFGSFAIILDRIFQGELYFDEN